MHMPWMCAYDVNILHREQFKGGTDHMHGTVIYASFTLYSIICLSCSPVKILHRRGMVEMQEATSTNDNC